MNTDQDFILSTFSILMNKHNLIISSLVEKSKLTALSQDEQLNLNSAFEAYETYSNLRNKMIINWSK